MSDFDFDELDKAVAGVTSSDTDHATPETEAPREEPAEEAPARVETSRVVPAARRSSGRFMDVVHPSSDMRSRSTPAVVEPSSSSSEKAFIPPAAKTEAVSKEDTREDAFEDKPESTEDGTVGEWSKPLETPFLADAKVEKRPLGGVGPEPSQALLDAPEEELKLEASDELLLEPTVMPDPIDFAAQTAALDSEKEDTSVPASAEQEEAEAQEQDIEQLDELKTPEVSTPPVLEVKTAEEPVGPTSISQQYTEQPATANQESGAIFDTENYHKPLAPAPKKRSGAWTVILILLLIILGAAAGVAFYLFVLPNL